MGEGQVCEDPDTSDKVLGDWVCKCEHDVTAMATLALVEVCDLHDECVDTGSVRGPYATCAQAMPEQQCIDLDWATDNTWECHCKYPSVGHAVREVSNCPPINECTMQCEHCADQDGTGTVCSKAKGQGDDAAAQTCHDPEPLSEIKNWVCRCPMEGPKKVLAAVPDEDCPLDECEMRCLTCADHGAGNVCLSLEQVCVEGDKHTGALGDWVCQCQAPFEWKSKKAAPAECSFDECSDVLPHSTHAPGDVCVNAGQLCSDHHHYTVDDFLCYCKEPELGSNTAAAATCETNECRDDRDNAAIVKTCSSALVGHFGNPLSAWYQTCVDPDWYELSNWYCECPDPTWGSAKAMQAVCSFDECKDYNTTCPDETAHRRCVESEAQGEDSRTCRTDDQTCVDTDFLSKDSWECHCKSGAFASVALADCAEIPVPPAVDSGANPDEEDNSCSFLGCYWWLLLLIVLLCSSACVVVALFVIRSRRDTGYDEEFDDGAGWHGKVPAPSDELEGFGQKSEGGESRTAMSMQTTELSAALITQSNAELQPESSV